MTYRSNKHFCFAGEGRLTDLGYILVGRYQMNAIPRGIALIINNEKFRGNFPNREGSNVDAEKLQELLEWLKFDVRSLHDQTAEEMYEAAQSLASEEHSKHDSVSMVVLSHGRLWKDDLGYISGVDGVRLCLEHFLDPFRKSKSLVGKPKLFFFQYCRGNNKSQATEAECKGHFFSPSTATPDVEDNWPWVTSSQPHHEDSDTLLCFSSTPGCLSYRDETLGSRYVNTLDKVVRAYAHDLHLLDMLTIVNRRMNTHDISHKKQFPDQHMGLTKRLYFF